MASKFGEGNFGDSERNQSDAEGEHVFDGAGENIHCHSDSESLASRASKTRYINPAIYVETVEATHSATSLQADSAADVVTPHPHSTYRSNSTPFLSGRASTASSGSIKRKCCKLGNIDSPKSGKLDLELEDETPRLDRTYRESGMPAMDTFRLSVASLSTTTTDKDVRDQNEKKRQEAFQQWLARKDQKKRERARIEKLKMQPAPTISAEKREESYRRWLEMKRVQDERRRAESILRQYRENEELEQQRRNKEQAKESKLVEWARKKEEKLKAMKLREERKAALAQTEDQRRRAGGERAYQDWLKTSKNKPLPVPLNQGVLSMRGSVSQMYVNPVPWKSLI